MKKLLAFLIVATMLATVALCAFSVSAASATNIALGKKATYPISTRAGVSFYNADLTDGVAATSLSYGDPDKEWFSFYYNPAATDEGNINVEHSDNGINVGTAIVDLASASTIDSVRIHFNKGYLPTTAEVLVSEDGTTYTTYAKKDINQESGEIIEWGMWVEFAADASVNGRYVKLVCTFPDATMFCMLNEIEVYGAEDRAAGGEDDGDETTSGDDENSETTGGEDNSETTGGEENISSTSTPAASESTPAENDKPTTGDAGLLAFAALAVLAVAGSVVAIRVRH